MDIPDGLAMPPLAEDDLADFIYNYFKAEYAPIRSIFSFAKADPRMGDRWHAMGEELRPSSIQHARAQPQRDLESLNEFIRNMDLDVIFLQGILVRFKKYGGHERLDKKLFESGRIDLMVKKALKERCLIEALWPNSLSRDSSERVQRGHKVRQWYMDMYSKYFQDLRDVTEYELKSGANLRIRNARQKGLMLIPHTEHIAQGKIIPAPEGVFASVKSVSKAKRAAASQSSTQTFAQGSSTMAPPERLETHIATRFDATGIQTHNVRQTVNCLKCSETREISIIIINHLVSPPPYTDDLLDMSPAASENTGPVRTAAVQNMSAPRQAVPNTAPSAIDQANLGEKPTQRPRTTQNRIPRREVGIPSQTDGPTRAAPSENVRITEQNPTNHTENQVQQTGGEVQTKEKPRPEPAAPEVVSSTPNTTEDHPRSSPLPSPFARLSSGFNIPNMPNMPNISNLWPVRSPGSAVEPPSGPTGNSNNISTSPNDARNERPNRTRREQRASRPERVQSAPVEERIESREITSPSFDIEDSESSSAWRRESAERERYHGRTASPISDPYIAGEAADAAAAWNR